MISIDEFYELLEEVCSEMPEELFEDLHQGIVLEEEVKFSPHARNNDLLIMGEYHRSRYGNRISIYYGSFAYCFPHAGREYLKDRLREIVRHELRHHMENRSGIYGHDSLEHEDAVSLRKYIEAE